MDFESHGVPLKLIHSPSGRDHSLSALSCILWYLHPELRDATDGERPAGEKHGGARAGGHQVGVLLLRVCVSRAQH